MKRWFTSDFHFGMKDIIKYENRPFDNVDDMNQHFIAECCRKAKVYKEVQADGTQLIVDRDVIIHAGDLAMFGEAGLSINPQRLISQIPAMFINIKGNHDTNNKVKSVATMMRTALGSKYVDVSISHYPSYDKKAAGMFKPGDIHLCGHVHSSWKHCLDVTHKVLNINIGVDVWNYSIISEHDLIMYIDSVIKLPKDKIYKVAAKENGKIVIL